MGIFSALSEWSNNRYEKRVSKMREQGRCPDCSGRGIGLSSYDHYYSNIQPCPGCNGSGTFEDWMR